EVPIERRRKGQQGPCRKSRRADARDRSRPCLPAGRFTRVGPGWLALPKVVAYFRPRMTLLASIRKKRWTAGTAMALLLALVTAPAISRMDCLMSGHVS